MTIQTSAKKLIKESPLYGGYSFIRRKFQNYFSYQGLATRKLWHTLAQFDQELHVKQRKQIAQQLRIKASENVRAIASELEKNGYAYLTFEKLGIEVDALMDLLYEHVETFKANQHSQKYLSQLPQAKYFDRLIAYKLYKKADAYDPFLDLAFHPNLVQIASLYIGYLPIFEEISLTCTAPLLGDLFGSQLWHRDSQQKRILKLFFSPVDLNEKNGPFEFFPPEKSSLKYYKNCPEAMRDDQIKASGLDPKEALVFAPKKGECLLVDVERCLHRGGIAKEQRFMCTISFSSPIYSFSKKQYRRTGTYETSFKTYAKENAVLFESFKASSI